MKLNTTPIATTDALASICAQFARQSYVTVDTEFMRETTYYPILDLIQIASVEEAVLIDPLAENIDLSPFLDLMANPGVTKVFHSARQDLEIIWNLGKIIPSPLFDTQIAAMVCGYGDSVSYEQLCNDLAHAKVDKSSRFTDWSRRPLSESQLAYALSDVTHLTKIYENLLSRLQENGRLDWIDEEMGILTSPETYKSDPANAWRRLAGRIRKSKDLPVLMELAAWRESEAQSRNVPRGRVLKDDVLTDVAISAPRSIEALGKLRSIPKGFERSQTGADLIATVERGLNRDPDTVPKLEKHRSRNGASAVVDLLKVLLKAVSENEKVAPKVIATTDDLEAIAVADDADVPALQGWRRTLFGDKALALKKGQLALAVVKGHVTFREISE